MNLSSKELKCKARGILTGSYGLPMSAFVIVELLTAAVNFPFDYTLQGNPGSFQIVVFLLASFIIALLGDVLNCGLNYIHLCLARGKQVRLADLFLFFRKRPDRILLAGLLLSGLSLLVMLPGILLTVMAVVNGDAGTGWYALAALAWIAAAVLLLVISLSYGLVYYFLIDEPDMGVIQAFRESRRRMRGNKGRMLYISVSFLGLLLLCVLSLGIGFLWVTPYKNQTYAEFYQNVRGELYA